MSAARAWRSSRGRASPGGTSCPGPRRFWRTMPRSPQARARWSIPAGMVRWASGWRARRGRARSLCGTRTRSRSAARMLPQRGTAVAPASVRRSGFPHRQGQGWTSPWCGCPRAGIWGGWCSWSAFTPCGQGGGCTWPVPTGRGSSPLRRIAQRSSVPALCLATRVGTASSPSRGPRRSPIHCRRSIARPGSRMAPGTSIRCRWPTWRSASAAVRGCSPGGAWMPVRRRC